MQIETFNHAESTGDAQEKQARSYEPVFAEKKKFVNSKFGAHLFQPVFLYVFIHAWMFNSKKIGNEIFFCIRKRSHAILSINNYLVCRIKRFIVYL